MASQFVESAILRVVDESTAPLNKINKALGNLRKTADALARSTAFNPVAGAAAANNLAQMATTAERIGRAFGGVARASNAVGASRTRQLEMGERRVEQLGRLSAAQIRNAQRTIEREYATVLRRIQDETAAAHRTANANITANAAEHANTIRRAGETVAAAATAANNATRAANAAATRPIAPPPPPRRVAPPPPPAPRRPADRIPLRGSQAEDIRRAISAGLAPAQSLPTWSTRITEEERRKQQEQVAIGSAAAVASAVKKSASEQFELRQRNISRTVQRADDRVSQAEERLARSRDEAARTAARVAAQEAVVERRRQDAQSQRKTDMDNLARSEAELTRRQTTASRASLAARDAEHSAASARTLRDSARDTAALSGDRIVRSRDRLQEREDRDNRPLGRRMWDGTKTFGQDQLKYAYQGLVGSAVATALHEGWEGAKDISNTRAAMVRLGWNDKQRGLAVNTATQMARDFGTLTQGEAEKIYRESAALLHHPEDAAKVAPILAKAFQDQVQGGQSVREAEANSQRLIKAAEMSGYLTDQAGNVTPDKLQLFTDTVAKVQAIEGRQLTTRDTQMMVKYLRSASGPLDDRGLFTTMLLASEEGGSSAGTMINSLVRGMTGKAFEYARVGMVRSGLATGEIVTSKNGKQRVDNFQVNEEEGLRANWMGWIEKNLIGPDGMIAKTKDPKTGRLLDPTNRNDVSKFVDLVTSNRTAADALTKGINQAGAFKNKWEEAKHIDVSKQQSKDAGWTNLNVATQEFSSSLVTSTQRLAEAVPVLAPLAHMSAMGLKRVSEFLDWRGTPGGPLTNTRMGAGILLGPAIYAGLRLGQAAMDNPGTAAQIGAAAALTRSAVALTGSAAALRAGGLAGAAGGLAGGVGRFGLMSLAGAALRGGLYAALAVEAGMLALDVWKAVHPSSFTATKNELDAITGGVFTGGRKDPGINAPRTIAETDAMGAVTSTRLETPAEVKARVEAETDRILALTRGGRQGRSAAEIEADRINLGKLTDFFGGDDLRATSKPQGYLGGFIAPAFADDGRGDGMLPNADRAGGKAASDIIAQSVTESGGQLADQMAQAVTPLGEALQSAGEYAAQSIDQGGQSAAAAIHDAMVAGGSEAAAILAAAMSNINVNVSGAEKSNTGSNAGFVR